MARGWIIPVIRPVINGLGARGLLRFLLVFLLFPLGILVTLPLCHLVTLSPSRAEEGEGMPPFQRVLVPAERVAEEMKRVRDGVLVRMQRAEFEALVDKATQATTRKTPPRLLEARYRATLKDDALIGEGQWKLIHKGPGPGLLKLEPFNLAVRQARFENGEASIAAFDGKSPALLVETAGERTVSLDWSARAESGPEGLQFHLETPSSPVALLELDVPAERGVTVLTDGALLSGPHEAETAALRRWKIMCGGRPAVDVRILPADRSPADAVSIPFVRQRTTQKLHPQGLDATFELTLDGLGRGVRELVCECDAELSLREVVGPNVDGCSFQAGDDKKPSRLTIRLREPMRAGTWRIFCLAPLNRSPSPGGAQPIAWRSPGLRLVNGVSRGETLSLELHPQVRVESWDSGHFRFISSELDRTRGGQLLTLQGGGLGPPRRPQAHLRVHGVEFRVQQWTWWRCDDSGMALTVQIAWDVRQGQLFQLPVRLPPQWNVEKVELSPAALLRDWRVRGPANKRMLLVDLAKAIELRTNGEGASETAPRSPAPRPPLLTVHLKPVGTASILGKWLPFPDATPQGARFREGVLALDGDEQLFHLDVSTTAERSEADGEGPWQKHLPEYYYRYKDQLPQGRVRVRARPPRLQAKCETEVSIAAGPAALETHLLLEAETGNPNTIDLALSSNDGGPWSWRNEAAPRGDDKALNRVVRLERLKGEELSFALRLLSGPTPLHGAAALATRPNGERWRLTLARPLRAHEPLRLRARRSLQPADNRWDVPLPVVLGVERMEGEVRLHLERGDLVQLHTVGLREAAAVPGKGATPWRTFRYGQNAVGLTLSGPLPASARSAAAVIDRARLLTYVGADGVLRHHFSFQVANWNEHTLPLRLPADAKPLAVRVDGRWLPRLLPRDAENNTGAAKELILPAPLRDDAGGDSVHRFEVVYTRTLPLWRCWQRFDAPAPTLPLAPLSFRRLWAVPAPLTPLTAGRFLLVPGTEDAGALSALPRRFADLFRLPQPWRRLDPLTEEPQTATPEALEHAVQQLRGHHADQTISLGEMVSALAFDYLKDRYTILLDVAALRQAGIGLQTAVPIERLSANEASPPWTACGLIAVPARSAIVLTTRCGRGAALREPLDEEMEKTLAFAAKHGQDPSGRFRSALSWLHPDSGPAGVPPPLDFDAEGTNWSEWEPIAGAADDSLLVVRRDAVTAAGLALVVALALVFWMLRRSSLRRLRTLLLSSSALLGVGAAWLPAALRDLAWWPLLAVGLGALAWYFRVVLASKNTFRRPNKTNAAVAGAVLLALNLFGWSSRAEAPTSAAVYLVPATSDEKQMVLVPADLLERLKAWTKPAPLASGGPWTVLLDASYEGQLTEGQAEFATVFSAFSQREEASTLTLPLADVQLVGEVLLDGARVAPLALPAPQAGFSLTVRGRGRHKIELRFRVPVAGTVEDRNVLFTVPSLPRSHLAWRVPAGAVEPQVLVKYGAQWTTRDNDGERLEADLGALPRPVHIHWYQPSAATNVAYRAAYRWDLGVEANRLTAWLRYRVRQGAVKTLQVDLPDDLEVSSASAQRTASAAPPPWRPRFALGDWHVRRADGKRRLYLDFPYPISGDFQVTLKLLPRGPLSATASLPLPSPHGVRASGSHYLAYHTEARLNAQRDTSNYLTRIGADEFAADWPDGPRLEANFSGGAYRITPDRTPQLVLRLQQTPPAVESDVDVAVRAGAHWAEMSVNAVLKIPNRDAAYLEWELPAACTIASVSGDEVRTWKQHGARLLIWLNRTTSATRLELSGWLPLHRAGVRSHLELNGPRLQSSSKQRTRLHLLTGGDLVLSEIQTRNLRPVPPAGSERREREAESTFETSDSTYQVRCNVGAAANAVARVLTLAEADERELRFTSTVIYRVTHGELRHVRLRLRHWRREQVELQAERVTQPPSPRRTANERTWDVSLPPGVAGTYRVTLHGRMPLDDASLGVRMPEVVVEGVERAEYFLAVAGELAGQASGTLQTLDAPRKELASSWPSEGERIERAAGRAWRVSGTDWLVRLQPRTRTAEPTPVRVFLWEQSAAVVDGRRWLHEARCWLHHDGHTDVNLAFPAAARLLAAAVDGVDVTPSPSASSRLWLPLPGRPGVRCLRLRWMYDRPEPLDRPQLTAPRVADAVQGPTLWTVMIPAGWDANSGAPAASLGSGATREAALALHRAAAQLHIRQTLAKQGNARSAAALAEARRRFALHCRHARQAFAQGGERGHVLGPKGQSLIDWLRELEAAGGTDADKETGRQGDKEKETESSFSLSPCLPVSLSETSGVPMSWQAPAGAKPPLLQLTPISRQDTNQALAASAQWLGGLFIVWILSWSPFLLARLRSFWPEQIALAGLLGWHLAGLTSIVAALFLAAACGRAFLLVRALRGLWRKRRDQPSTMNAGGGVAG
jgi:hypothetical protein